MTHRRPLLRPPILGALSLSLVAAVLTTLSVFHVPEGSIAACGGSLHEAGWHFRLPLRRVRIVPLSGRLERVGVEVRTEEGATVAIRLSFDYTLDPHRLRTQAGALAHAGLEALAARLVSSALGPLSTGSLFPTDQPAGSAGRGPLPPPALDAISRALRSAGIEPSGLIGRAGPPGSDEGEAHGAGAGPAGGGAPTRAIETPRGSSSAAGAGSAHPGTMPRAEPTGLRLLLIGLDGADWDLIDPLLRQGRMPNLARLLASGVRGPLRSYDPMISPLLWTTMVTGVGPDVHGVADFQAIDQATGRRVPITSRFRKVKALWNILSDAGRSSAFVAWWASYPAEKVEGVQVSNLVVYETLRPKPKGAPVPPGITYPADYFERIRPALHTAADLSFEEVRSILKIDRQEFEAARRELLQPKAKDEEQANRQAVQQPVPLAISILTGSKNYAAIAADLASRHLDMTAVYFEGIDMMGHRFQHCLPPRIPLCPEGDFERYHDAVTAFYIRQDDLLGPILKAAGPGTTVLVVSDHGFKTGAGRPAGILPFTTQQPVEWHDEEGIFILSGPGARRGERLMGRPTLFDIAPTILYLLGLPQARTMPGRVVREAIEPAFERAHAPSVIPTYETLGAPREVMASTGPGAEEAEQELLSNLRALGYIGGDGQPSGAGTAPSSGPSPAEGKDAGAAAGQGEATQVFYHRNLATYFLKRQEYAKAAEQLRLANERQKLPKTYQMLAEAYAGLGRTDDAVAVLEEALKSVEGMDAESILWMVQIRLAGSGPGAAAAGWAAAAEIARRWTALTAKRPGLDEAIAGLLKESEGDTRGAADLYRRSLAADPTRVVAAQRLFAMQGPEGGAGLEPILRAALAKDPRIDEYHNLLGVILASTGRAREAIGSFQRACDLDPDNPRFAVNLAGGLARLGRWQDAATAYERAGALEPSAANFMKLGSVYRRLSRPDRALAAFERARAAGESGSGALLGIALAHRDLKQMPEALAAAREGLGRFPGDPGLRALYDELVRTTGSRGPAPGPPGSGR